MLSEAELDALDTVIEASKRIKGAPDTPELISWYASNLEDAASELIDVMIDEHEALTHEAPAASIDKGPQTGPTRQSLTRELPS